MGKLWIVRGLTMHKRVAKPWYAFRIWLYEFLATPAHIWLWLVARLVGGRFTYCHETTDDKEKSK